jgi:hypothetical protein
MFDSAAAGPISTLARQYTADLGRLLMCGSWRAPHTHDAIRALIP